MSVAQFVQLAKGLHVQNGTPPLVLLKTEKSLGLSTKGSRPMTLWVRDSEEAFLGLDTE